MQNDSVLIYGTYSNNFKDANTFISITELSQHKKPVQHFNPALFSNSRNTRMFSQFANARYTYLTLQLQHQLQTTGIENSVAESSADALVVNEFKSR